MKFNKSDYMTLKQYEWGQLSFYEKYCRGRVIR